MAGRNMFSPVRVKGGASVANRLGKRGNYSWYGKGINVTSSSKKLNSYRSTVPTLRASSGRGVRAGTIRPGRIGALRSRGPASGPALAPGVVGVRSSVR